MITVGAVIRDARGRVLLVEHAFRSGNAWGIPGGFLNRGEQPEEAIRREIREEVGLELEAVNLASVRSLSTVDQLEILFVCRSEGVPQPDGIEILAARWFSTDDLWHKLNSRQCELIRRALEGVRPPSAD